jgi:hypothetical protein
MENNWEGVASEPSAELVFCFLQVQKKKTTGTGIIPFITDPLVHWCGDTYKV